MSIGKKMYAGFGVVLFIVLLSALWNYLELSKVKTEYADLLESRVAQTVLAKDIQVESALQGFYIRSYIMQGRDEDLANFEKHTLNQEKALNELDPLVHSDEMQDFLEQVKESSEVYKDASVEVIAVRKSGKSDEAAELLKTTMRPSNIEIREAVDGMVEYQLKHMKSGQQRAEQLMDKAILAFILAAALSLIIGVAIAAYMSRIISRPIKLLSASAAVIASGDLTEPDAEVRTKDEIRDLALSFNNMKHKLRQLITGVNDNALHLTASAEELSASTHEVADSSEEITRAIENLAQGSSASAISAKDSAVAMDETASGVQRIAESTTVLQGSAEQTMNVANESEKTIQTAKEQMNVIYESSQETSELIKKLSRQSIEIENITNVITSITEQTNLLALNAAIEAARAGEHGKGFAVVADEVRKLAEESKSSASQIAQLTVAIQADTRNVEHSVSESMTNVEQGVQVIEDAGQSFHDIVQSVQQMTSQIEEISAATEEISASAEEVSASVNEIAGHAMSASEQTEQNSAAMEEQMATIEEINAVAQDLSKKAVELQEMVQQFTV
ncbi:methyl-accepting chemotaxis protein [Sporosarcina jeotgali]|uniref:Methyl-accepting chemotaxis protein n=1 Tax=Sporosarcina jeotgali TaxID=3020056 RepID=A0ABZ0KXP5_9BACL|nr:methyl-accepting chemotaxis protein [Sporosarcina sp. B2O-1]WOV84938.1 methyl-accepting chemotaxis protein [Sporosarcina sp. B2O-1]